MIDICVGRGGQILGLYTSFFGQSKIASFLPVFFLNLFAKLAIVLIAC